MEVTQLSRGSNCHTGCNSSSKGLSSVYTLLRMCVHARVNTHTHARARTHIRPPYLLLRELTSWNPLSDIFDDSPTKHKCSTFEKNNGWDSIPTPASSFCLQNRHSFLAQHSPLSYFPVSEKLLNPMNFNRIQWQ